MKTRSLTAVGLLVPLLAAVGLGACRDDPTRPSDALSIQKAPTNSGDGQADTVFTSLAPFRVLVRRGTTPVEGVAVFWRIVSDSSGRDSSGYYSPGITTATDSSGIASATLTLGGKAGLKTVEAYVLDAVGSPVRFTATARPGAPTILRIVSGNYQVGNASSPLGADYKGAATDSYDNGVAGVVIDWAVTTGGGSITPMRTTTAGPNGYVLARHTLGALEGPQSVTATAAALPDASQVTFTAFTSVLTFADVSAGFHHTCGVTTEGVAYCWGDNTQGQLGDGTRNPHTTLVAVQGRLRFSAIGSGYFHTCGITATGTAYCWGQNAEGQLGLGDGTATDHTTPVEVLGGLSFATVSVGGYHTCGVTMGGTAYCWGGNSTGQLGDGTAIQRTSPVAVSGGLSFAAIEAGGLDTCGITTAGAAYCWGNNGDGELGVGTAAGPEFCNGSRGYYGCSTVPVAVLGNLPLAGVSPGLWHTCGVTTGGAAYCWGDDLQGQLGIGSHGSYGRCISSAPCMLEPAAVLGGLTFTAVSAGGAHTCGVTAESAAYCWGRNADGQVGNSTGVDPRYRPLAVLGGLSFGAVSAGVNHTCGVTTGGMAYCWGRNADGQLGDGTTTQRNVPVKVLGQP